MEEAIFSKNSPKVPIFQKQLNNNLD